MILEPRHLFVDKFKLKNVLSRLCRQRSVDSQRSFFAWAEVVSQRTSEIVAKTDIFLRLGARVVAVEPDGVNQEILEQKFIKLRLASKPVIIVCKAVSDRNTRETMWIDEPGSAKNTLSQKWVETLRADEKWFGHKLHFAHQKEVETITLQQLIRTHGFPFFVKIDVEGYELTVLRGMSVPAPYVSFEVNLPEFRREGLECIELLDRMAAGGKFNYGLDCRNGLVLDRWLDARDFSQVLSACNEHSLGVFWKHTGASERDMRAASV